MGKATINDFGEVYSGYAAGCLDPAFSLLVETQAALRPDVARAVARAETIAGVFLETEERAAVSANAMDKALAMIDAFEAGHQPEPRAQAIHMAGEGLDELLDLPEPLRETALTSFQNFYVTEIPRYVLLESNGLLMNAYILLY